jgi:hypothetical protein
LGSTEIPSKSIKLITFNIVNEDNKSFTSSPESINNCKSSFYKQNSPKFNDELIHKTEHNIFKFNEQYRKMNSLSSYKNNNSSNHEQTGHKFSEFTFNNREGSHLFTYSYDTNEIFNTCTNNLNTIANNIENQNLFSSPLMQNCVILDNEIQYAEKVILEDVEGDLLWKKILILDGCGLLT